MIQVEEIGVPASMAGLGEEPSAGMQIAANVLTGVFNKIELRNAYSKPIVYGPNEIRAMLLDPPKPREPGSKTFLERVKPTLVLDFKAGTTKTIAPFGVATADEWQGNTGKIIAMALGALVLYTAAGVYLGYRWGRRSR